MATAKSKRSILIINPNTTTSMTEALKPTVDSLGFYGTTFGYYTASSGVPSINNEEDAATSAEACLSGLKEMLPDYDGFLVCCYSEHPLVPKLRQAIIDAGYGGKVVAGMFEASISTCLQAINVVSTFGIISTGNQWEEILTSAVTKFLGIEGSSRYVGTETTGLNADELHTTPKDEVDRKMKDAAKRLLDKGVQAVCLGCAGMAGLNETVREACVEYLGEEKGRRIMIIDGVANGVILLEGAFRVAY